MPHETGRERGVLSPRDRRYLLNPEKYDKAQTERNCRQDIRNRIINALQDFDLLLQRPQKDDFETISGYIESKPPNEIYNGLVATIAFALRLGSYADVDDEQLLEAAVRRNDSMLDEVEVSIERTWRKPVDPAYVRHKIETGQFPSAFEIAVALTEGELEEQHIERLKSANCPDKWDVIESF